MPTKFKWGLLKREAAAYAKLLRLPYILDKIQEENRRLASKYGGAGLSHIKRAAWRMRAAKD